ncbi:sensor histidine kinase [Pedobacter sp. L105]|uniref:sensor histidine kinase n=1 Tax=Pedobacter sp. L105 TaxID=1641871 RepID=UPI00131C64EF|nr:histidine kinase [Pedobacter sp. L105]
MKRQISYQTIVMHLLFWLAFISYQAISNGWEDTDQLSFKLSQQLFTLTIPVTILLTYFNLYVLMPVFYYHQKYLAYAAGILLLLLSGGLLQRYIAYTFIIPWEQFHNPVRYQQENKHFWIPVRILRLAIESYPVVALTMVIQLMHNAYNQEKNLREIEKEKFSAEMGLLKAQINPHFFFNTLNSLYALTLKGSDKASKVVLRLSELMHYMLYEARADKVFLKDELSHLENYISIEQMRFADRLDLCFQHSGDISGKMIAPLLLLPFVENAFKHGITDDAGWITINLKVIGNQLFLKVENSYPKNVNKSVHGLGLINVKRRLELTYPDSYDLQFIQNNEIFEASLKLEL